MEHRRAINLFKLGLIMDTVKKTPVDSPQQL
jgi:hypothetical protein